MSLACFRTVTVIHSENLLLEDIYVNSTDTKQEVGFDFSSLNVSLLASFAFVVYVFLVEDNCACTKPWHC